MANPTGKNQYTGRSATAKISSARKQRDKSPKEFGTIFRNLKNVNMSTRDALKKTTHETRMVNVLKAHGKYRG